MDSETEGKEDHGQDGFTLMLLAMDCRLGKPYNKAKPKWKV